RRARACGPRSRSSSSSITVCFRKRSCSRKGEINDAAQSRSYRVRGEGPRALRRVLPRRFQRRGRAPARLQRKRQNHWPAGAHIGERGRLRLRSFRAGPERSAAPARAIFALRLQYPPRRGRRRAAKAPETEHPVRRPQSARRLDQHIDLFFRPGRLPARILREVSRRGEPQKSDRAPRRDLRRRRDEDLRMERSLNKILRALFSFLLGVSLLAPALAGAAAAAKSAEEVWKEIEKLPPAERQKRLVEGAKSEKEMLWYTNTGIDNANNYIRAFKKAYPFVNAKVWRAKSRTISDRFLTESRAGVYLADVVKNSTNLLPPLFEQKLIG